MSSISIICIAGLAAWLQTPDSTMCKSDANRGGEKPVHVVCPLSFGGAPVADTQWFTLPQSGFAPYVPPFLIGLPFPAVIPLNVPYTTPGVLPSAAAGDNPAISGIASHANITRYWASPPSFVISIPPTVPKLPSGGGPALTTPISVSFPGIPLSPYTWGAWVTAVTNTFAKYTSVTTSTAGAVSLGAAYSPVNYTTTAGGGMAGQFMPTAVLAAGQFIWGSTWAAPYTGPTGNGINEIILTDQPALSGGIGLTSMLVDPKTGIIIECDVLIYVGPPAAGTVLPPGVPAGGPGVVQVAGGGVVTAPNEWTALTHEIGHFFGLDHTNLHPGAVGGTLGTPGVPQVFQLAAFAGLTFASFPNGLLTVAGIPVLVPPVPGMVGRISHLQTGYDYTLCPLHPDDSTSLSKIYPVPMPAAGKVPLINITGRIEGRQLNAAASLGVYGRNMWLAPEGTTGAPGIFPIHGVISGTARLDQSDATLFNGPLTPYYYFSFPGLTYFPGTSVVGALGATGDFSIEGVLPGTLAAPANYEVNIENGAVLGASDANLAEWFQEPGFYTGNAMAPAVPFGTHILRSFAAIYGPAFSSMQMVPGTVIALDPFDHGDFLFTAPVGSLGVLPDSKVRPLIDITPRFGRAGAAPVTITAVPTPLLTLDLTTATLFINGAAAPFALPAPTFSGTTATWTIPMTTFTTLPGITPTTPLNVSFIVSNLMPPGFTSFGAFGRNDVVF